MKLVGVFGFFAGRSSFSSLKGEWIETRHSSGNKFGSDRSFSSLKGEWIETCHKFGQNNYFCVLSLL
ncbi:hypothetical protein LEP1GSC126_4277 [Leptospira kirschneri str. 200801774]|nr:hypothetical protein LEP1GSC126_4277 [Leptospira kirschneri str. 200801774]